MTRSLAAALLFAGGCAPLYWVRPDTPPEQFARDIAQCRDEAWRASWQGWHYRPFGPWLGHGVYGQPVLVHPYGPFNDPFHSRAMDERRLAQYCMRARGYQLVPENELPS